MTERRPASAHIATCFRSRQVSRAPHGRHLYGHVDYAGRTAEWRDSAVCTSIWEQESNQLWHKRPPRGGWYRHGWPFRGRLDMAAKAACATFHVTLIQAVISKEAHRAVLLHRESNRDGRINVCHGGAEWCLRVSAKAAPELRLILSPMQSSSSGVAWLWLQACGFAPIVG